MTCRHGALATVALAFLAAFPRASPVDAADLPAIRTSESNTVAACATPGRLMAFLKARNTSLDPRFSVVSVEYMRHGEALAVRWDYAFFQMLLETGFLTYTGDVKPEQNNFAGLGATGGGVRGESFENVSSGVRAHIEHLLMYSGERIESPVAERTRNIQEWGVLTKWQKTIEGPMTFAHLAKQWAPGNRRYASDIKAIADRFFSGTCNEADPQPELVAEAHDAKTVAHVAAAGSGAATPRQEEAAPSQPPLKASLSDGSATTAGAPAGSAPASPAKAADPKPGSTAPAATTTLAVATPPAVTIPAATPPASPRVTVLNPATTPDTSASPGATTASAPSGGEPVETAAVVGGPAAGPPAAGQKEDGKKCRVWTASYGGTKAILIKAIAEKTVNYTVLDVNDGAEKRETEAYIKAYAKGGQSVGEFASQAQALDKAFELCPEG